MRRLAVIPSVLVAGALLLIRQQQTTRHLENNTSQAGEPSDLLQQQAVVTFGVTTVSSSATTTTYEPRQETLPASFHPFNATQITDTEECLNVRGSQGHWVKDVEFSVETFYAHGRRSTAWLRKHPDFRTNRTAHYKGNAFRWNDTNRFFRSGGCQIQPVTKSFFCSTMQALGVGRIFFVGDSLMGAQVESLFKLVGVQEKKQRHLSCPTSVEPIAIRYWRENLGPNLRVSANPVKDRQQYGPEIPFCKEATKGLLLEQGKYCPWHMEYNSSSTVKTLLVLNQGAHFHAVESFSNSLDLFVDRINEIAHPGDIVVFRSTVPGHKDCFETPSTRVVDMTYKHFLERYATTQFDWNLFENYNHYAKQKLSADLSPSLTFHYLNVYNMTVLRNDEHVSAKDCLHYTHPGPIDFWNHLLLTDLADLAKLH